MNPDGTGGPGGAGPTRDELLRRLLDGPADPVVEPPKPLPTTLVIPPATTFDEDWDANLPTSASHVDPDRRVAWGVRARHLARLAVFAIAVIGALAGVGVAWLHIVSDPLSDARTYYDAATRLSLGHAAALHGYAPLLAIVLRPLALLPYQAFALLWELLVVASFALLVRHLGVRSERTWLAIGVLGIPIGWALAIAQAQVPLTLLVAIGQPWSIALAANVQVFPALVALWWIGRRDWQATIAFGAWAVLLAVAQFLLAPDGLTTFFRTLDLDSGGGIQNISPYVTSPAAWLILLFAGIAATLLVARTRWGWPAAVAVATLASPRLLVYGLMTLVAMVREPDVPKPEIAPRPVAWVRRAKR